MGPRAREDQLVIQELPDEVLVYDVNRHKAHCLSRTAAFIWRHCDGQTSVARLAALLAQEVKGPVEPAVVWLALDRLGKARLLRERVAPPAGLSRREVMRKLALVGGLAALLPVVSSIVAPTAAQAASCVDRAVCQANVPPFCTGQPICNDPGKCCVVDGNQCDRQNC